MSDVRWHKLYVDLQRFGDDNIYEEIAVVESIAWTLHKKRLKSSPWYRINGSYYELLIPNLTDRDIEVLDSLGYNLFKSDISRSTRRHLYTKLKKPKK